MSEQDRESKSVLCEGRYLRFVRRGTWEYVERRNISGIVGLVPVTDEGQLVLVEQYRPPVARNVIELPAGLVGDRPEEPEETLLAAARRELLEETGYEAGRIEPLTEGAASAGSADEILTLLLATNLRKVGPGGGDAHEQITVHLVPLDQAAAWLDAKRQAGLVIDLKVYAGLYFASAER